MAKQPKTTFDPIATSALNLILTSNQNVFFNWYSERRKSVYSTKNSFDTRRRSLSKKTKMLMFYVLIHRAISLFFDERGKIMLFFSV